MRWSTLDVVDDGEWRSCLARHRDRNRFGAALTFALALHVVAFSLPAWVSEPEPLELSRRGSAHGELDVQLETEAGRESRAAEHLVSTAPAAIENAAAQPVPPIAKSSDPDTHVLEQVRPALTNVDSRRAPPSPRRRAITGSGAGQSGSGAKSGSDIFGGHFDYTGPTTLRAEFCKLPPTTTSIADLGKCSDLGSRRVKRIDVPKRHYSEGFPGAGSRNEFIGARYTGTFVVKNSGLHRFRLLSDDGSQLFIDGRLLIDNDGLHGVRSVIEGIQLEAGPHEIMLTYFQGPGVEIALQLFVTSPHFGERLFTTPVW